MRQLFLLVCLAGLGLIPFAPVREAQGRDKVQDISLHQDAARSDRASFEDDFWTFQATLYYANKRDGKLVPLCPAHDTSYEYSPGHLRRIGPGHFFISGMDGECNDMIGRLVPDNDFYVMYDGTKNNPKFYKVRFDREHVIAGPLVSMQFEIESYSGFHPASKTDPVVPAPQTNSSGFLNDVKLLLGLSAFVVGFFAALKLILLLMFGPKSTESRPAQAAPMVAQAAPVPPQLSARVQIDQTLARIHAIDEAARERSMLIERHGALVRSELDRLSTNDASAEERERLVRQLVAIHPTRNMDEIEALIHGPAEPQA